MERICEQCQRAPHVGYNKPHSLHRTKRIVRPNLQMVAGRWLCTRCQRTETKRRSTLSSVVTGGLSKAA